MSYEDFLQEQTFDWEKVKDELMAAEQRADRIYDHNGRVLNICSVVGALIIVAAIATWIVTGNYWWAYMSWLGPAVIWIGYPIFKKDYD